MCGIAGIVNGNTEAGGYPGDPLKQQLNAMADSLRHRGPNGQFTWTNENNQCGLAHRRLSIIDLSQAACQPMLYRNRYTIVHNGEIYNYIELKKELQALGHNFITQSDTEVILAAYDEWDEDCVLHFDGMFSFAIWDNQLKELFAARDRFGEKPFFYYLKDKKFVFGSEIKALWAVGAPKELNLRMVFNFITIGYTDNPADPSETFYNEIKKLPAASRLYFAPDENDLYIDQYWDLEIKEKNKRISEADAIRQFTELLQTSVQRRLRSDVPVGTSLSGGLDSSSILMMMQSLSKQNTLSAFTAIFPGFSKDESAQSAMVANHFGIAHHTTAIEGTALMDDWEKLCYYQEEPFGSASIYAQFRVYQLAAQNGARVLLDGQGADETLAGYHKYYKWYWQELFIKRKLYRSGELQAANEKGINEQFGMKNIIASLLPDLASVILERQYLMKALSHPDLTKEFVRQQSREAYYTTPDYFNLNGALYFNTMIHGLEELLRYADRNSMAHGTETRLPFLNHELVEFIFSLPAQFKIKDGWTKYLLRKSMENKLPASIVWRKDKVGFEPPQENWMKVKKVEDAIQQAKQKLVAAKILQPSILEKPVAALSSHAPDNFDWRYLSVAAYL